MDAKAEVQLAAVKTQNCRFSAGAGRARVKGKRPSCSWFRTGLKGTDPRENSNYAEIAQLLTSRWEGPEPAAGTQGSAGALSGRGVLAH